MKTITHADILADLERMARQWDQPCMRDHMEGAKSLAVGLLCICGGSFQDAESLADAVLAASCPTIASEIQSAVKIRRAP